MYLILQGWSNDQAWSVLDGPSGGWNGSPRGATAGPPGFYYYFVFLQNYYGLHTCRGPSPKLAVVPGTVVGVGVGAHDGPAGGVSANEPAANGSAPPNVAWSHAN